MDDYSKNGINVDKEKKEIRVTYNGLLAQSGADKVYAVCGYGSKWSKQAIHEMRKTINGFETKFPTDEKVVNVAFKDSANNWDNNSGRNYSFSADDTRPHHFWV